MNSENQHVFDSSLAVSSRRHWSTPRLRLRDDENIAVVHYATNGKLQSSAANWAHELQVERAWSRDSGKYGSAAGGVDVFVEDAQIRRIIDVERPVQGHALPVVPRLAVIRDEVAMTTAQVPLQIAQQEEYPYFFQCFACLYQQQQRYLDQAQSSRIVGSRSGGGDLDIKNRLVLKDRDDGIGLILIIALALEGGFDRRVSMDCEVTLLTLKYVSTVVFAMVGSYAYGLSTDR
ncbi:hypothetical protein F5Y07DRAFT_403830 [Xylaria sp. FL0933]|nr:hypothetical protein F5Y07DRAFT_403830 [Xylaria sp. FL0933]